MKNWLFDFLIVALALCLINACAKDRDLNIKFFKDNAAKNVDSSGAVIINEYQASGSTVQNEWGQKADWIELYNTNDFAVNFKNTNYYITDDSTKPFKFTISDLSIPAKGFLLIYCDDSTKITATQIHTGFNLSSGGEFVGLFKDKPGGGLDTLTWRGFGVTNKISEGRTPDGGNTWTTFTTPTPGASNN